MTLDEIEKESVPKKQEKRGNLPSFFDDYQQYAEIVNYTQSLADLYPQYATFIPSIGKSVNGRDLPVLRIKGTSNPAKTVFFSSGMHAREWITIPTLLYFATMLLQNADQTDEQHLLANLEIIFLPIMNPDGYIYSWTEFVTFYFFYQKTASQMQTLFTLFKNEIVIDFGEKIWPPALIIHVLELTSIAILMIRFSILVFLDPFIPQFNFPTFVVVISYLLS